MFVSFSQFKFHFCVSINLQQNHIFQHSCSGQRRILLDAPEQKNEKEQMETNLRKFSKSVARPIISCLHLGQMHGFKPFLEICGL